MVRGWRAVSLFPLPIMRLVDAARGMVAVLRANSAMVRAHRLQARGKLTAALALAQSGLAVRGGLMFAAATQWKDWRLLR